MRKKGSEKETGIREPHEEYRTARRISATEASRNFSDIVNRALYRGESFIIERGGAPVCELRPAMPPHFTVADLTNLLSDLPSIDEDYLKSVEEISRSQPYTPDSPWER